jgi:protein-tyrosine phosphatase
VRLPARAPQGVPFRVLFVCLGNICRSPTAEGTMRELVREAGLEQEIELDSAGTGSWHAGSAPDERATAAAARRGIALEGAARRVSARDFDDFDLILAMDLSNLDELRRMAPSRDVRAKVALLREFDPASAETGDLDVPDPYYGEGDGFERVLDHVQAACAGLLARIRAGELP